MHPPFGLDIVQLVWAAFLPLVFFLLLVHKRRIEELLGKALAVYLLAWPTYEVVRVAVFPHSRDNWLVLGMKTFVVFVFLELAWGKIHPAREDEIPAPLVRALFIPAALLSFISVVLSFWGLL